MAISNCENCYCMYHAAAGLYYSCNLVYKENSMILKCVSFILALCHLLSEAIFKYNRKLSNVILIL